MYIDRYRSDQLSKSICDIYENHFYVTEKTDFARLVRLGTIEKFKKGDILKAAGFNSPATNAARGNIIDGGYTVQWTGPLYLN